MKVPAGDVGVPANTPEALRLRPGTEPLAGVVFHTYGGVPPVAW